MKKNKNLVLYFLTVILLAVFSISLFSLTKNGTNDGFGMILPDQILISNDDSIYFVALGNDKELTYLVEYDIALGNTRIIHKTTGVIKSVSLSKDNTKILFTLMEANPTIVSVIVYDLEQYKILSVLDSLKPHYKFGKFHAVDPDKYILLSLEANGTESNCIVNINSVTSDIPLYEIGFPCEGIMPIHDNTWCISSYNEIVFALSPRNTDHRIMKLNTDNDEYSYIGSSLKRKKKEEYLSITCAQKMFSAYRSLSKNEAVRLFEHGKSIKNIKITSNNLPYMELSSNGKYIAIAYIENGEYKIMDIINENVIAEIVIGGGTIFTWNDDSDAIYILSNYTEVIKYDIMKNETTKVYSIE